MHLLSGRHRRRIAVVQRRAPERRWIGRVEEFEARTLPNDCFFSPLHGLSLSASRGIDAPAAPPELQVGAAFDQLGDATNLEDAFRLSSAFAVDPALLMRPRGPVANQLVDVGSDAALSFPAPPSSGASPATAPERPLSTGGTDRQPVTSSGAAPLRPVAAPSGLGITRAEFDNTAAASAAAFLAMAHARTTAAHQGPPHRAAAPSRGLTKVGVGHRSAPTSPDTNLPGHVLVGYWHDFRNGAGPLRLSDVSPDFDVINVAFAETQPGSTSAIQFTVDPSIESDADFTADVASLQAQGKAVVLSIGGANGFVQLNTADDLNNFVQAVSDIVTRYGFDGIDIDFEGSAVHLNPGDTDFTNPTTPLIVNLNTALHQLNAEFGPQFIIGMAPETFFVQTGYVAYGGSAGAYLPVIYGCQDILTYLYVQDYNSGSMTALDNRIYYQGTADFHVAMTEMLLQGFPVAGGRLGFFPPLPPEQIAFGVPASLSAGGGFTPVADVQNALRYLIEGVPFGGTYQLINPDGYPALAGLMTWSINWDRFNNFALPSTLGPYLHGLP